MAGHAAVSDRVLLRIADANLNRAREGLRVCEEMARFVAEDPALTRRCQRLRYGLEGLARVFAGTQRLRARDARGDAGHPARRRPATRHRSHRDIAAANFRRAEEALRVLEELSRLRSIRMARSFGAFRFRVYDLEQKILSRLPPVRHR